MTALRLHVFLPPDTDEGEAAHAAPSDVSTVGALITAYLASKRSQVASGLIGGPTFKRAELYCLAFAKDYGSQAISACRRSDLKRWLTRHPEYASPFTKHDACGAIVTAFRWAAEEDLIAVCPYARPRDLPAKMPRQPIDAAAVRKILDHAKSHCYRSTSREFRLALYFLWHSGARTCEVRALRWEYWDDERACFELPQSKTSQKTGLTRIIVPRRQGVRLIRFLRRRSSGAGYVFLNGRGRPWTKDSFGTLFRRLANACGVKAECSAYSLRHGFTCELLEAGAGERQVADLLGQSSTRYVSWYGRGVKSKVDYLRETADRKK